MKNDTEKEIGAYLTEIIEKGFGNIETEINNLISRRHCRCVDKRGPFPDRLTASRSLPRRSCPPGGGKPPLQHRPTFPIIHRDIAAILRLTSIYGP